MIRIFLFLVVSSTLTACASGNVANKGQRTDVFQAVSEGAGVNADEVLVTLSASIKTHKETTFPLELANHGSDDYLLVVDFNDQSINLPAQSIEETTVTDPRTDPESGTGVRYTYRAIIRLKPGTYTMTAGLPSENVRIRQELQITSQVKNITIKPVYKASAGKKPASLRWLPDFRDGVKALNVNVQ
jgi:hypothetical protein